MPTHFMMSRIGAILFLLLMPFGIGKLSHYSKDGFSLKRISFPLPIAPDSSEDREALFFLQEPYRYLGRGRQCFAFESLDGRTVLKIPRFDRYFLPLKWKLPVAFLSQGRRELWKERQSRLAFTLKSFAIAAEELKDETGILYRHFHQTKCLPKRFVLYDRFKRRYDVDLNGMAFLLQRKTALLMPQLLMAHKSCDRERAERLLISFLDLIEKRSRLGIFNKDPSFLKNFGWEGEKAIQIDIGSFYRKENLSPEEAYSRSLSESVGPFREWLGRIDRDLLSFFDERLEKKW